MKVCKRDKKILFKSNKHVGFQFNLFKRFSIHPSESMNNFRIEKCFQTWSFHRPFEAFIKQGIELVCGIANNSIK